MKNFLKLCFVVFVFSACNQGVEPVATKGYETSVDGSSGSDTSSSGMINPSNVAQFSDIPIPDGAMMNSETTFIMGSGNNWTGRLVFNAPYTSNAVFEFYSHEMPKFGWSEITVVRADVNQMIYSQNGRIANIKISNEGSKAKVFLVMSPSSKENYKK